MSSNDDTNNDELVSQFMAFTGSSDASRAASYLEMGGGNLEMAVGLYMEHEQGASGGGGGGGGGGGAMGGPSGGAAAASASLPGFAGVGGGTGGGDFDVRAPDATRTMRLMDDGMMHTDPALQMMSAMMDEQLAQSAFSSPPGFRSGDYARAVVNQAAAVAEAKEDGGGGGGGGGVRDYDDDGGDGEKDDDAINVDDDDDDGDGANGSSSGPQAPARLSDMFAPPNHLIHKAGGFQGARASAKDSKRWLLVNIQRDSEFASHALNRDVWRDELVENLIREGFIFWQQMDMTPEGRTYTERYQVRDYPHLAIIDPRTGRLMWRKEGWTQENPMTPEVFAEHAMDFCSRNSFDRPPQAPRPAGSAGAAAPTRPAKRPMHEMSEDEQLQAAMRASMEDVRVEGVDDNGDDDDDDVEIEYADSGDEEAGCGDSKPAGTREEGKEEEPPSAVDSLLAVEVGDEPAGGARVQLRMPDGGRVVRKFIPENAVRTIYAFVAQNNDEARGGRGFVLMAGYPPNDLINDIDKTIQDCKLGGNTVTVRWK